MPARTRSTPQRRVLSPATIDRERKAHIATIVRARALGEQGNALLDKAQSLLTAHWGSANWDARAGILKTVGWLLNVALHHQQPAARLRQRQAPTAPATLRR